MKTITNGDIFVREKEKNVLGMMRHGREGAGLLWKG